MKYLVALISLPFLVYALLWSIGAIFLPLMVIGLYMGIRTDLIFIFGLGSAISTLTIWSLIRWLRSQKHVAQKEAKTDKLRRQLFNASVILLHISLVGAVVYSLIVENGFAHLMTLAYKHTIVIFGLIGLLMILTVWSIIQRYEEELQ